MLDRATIAYKIESADEQTNSSQPDPNQLSELPYEILLVINDKLPSVRDKAHLAVNHRFHRIFQPEVEKEVKDAAECAIYPIKENIEKLKILLKDCPALLLHPVTVKNRHEMVIKGTVYQIALHEGDNELIDDVIKEAFNKLKDGEEKMETQREEWLPKDWPEEEEKACAVACEAIDKVFTAFKNASNPNDVTELRQYPYIITINHQGAKEALEAFRKAIDALYKPTNEVITSGRDPNIRLLLRVIDRYEENHDALGGYNTPRNNAMIRSVFGYCQRRAPINFMQAFAQGPYYIVEKNEKLTRSFEYRNWRNHFILPLDSDPQDRLGYECFAGAGLAARRAACGVAWGRRVAGFQNFLSIKNNSGSTILRYATSGKVLRSNVD